MKKPKQIKKSIINFEKLLSRRAKIVLVLAMLFLSVYLIVDLLNLQGNKQGQGMFGSFVWYFMCYAPFAFVSTFVLSLNKDKIRYCYALLLFLAVVLLILGLPALGFDALLVHALPLVLALVLGELCASWRQKAKLNKTNR